MTFITLGETSHAKRRFKAEVHAGDGFWGDIVLELTMPEKKRDNPIVVRLNADETADLIAQLARELANLKDRTRSPW